jgi:hypothetical protein
MTFLGICLVVTIVSYAAEFLLKKLNKFKIKFFLKSQGKNDPNDKP